MFRVIRRWPWIMGLILGLAVGWHVPALGNPLTVVLEVAQAELALAVDPSSFNLSAIASNEVQEFTQRFRLANAGNVNIARVKAAVDLAGLNQPDWHYVVRTFDPGPGEFTVNAKMTARPDWLALPLAGSAMADLVPSPIAPGEAVDMDLRVRVGPRMPAGQGEFDVVFEIVP